MDPDQFRKTRITINELCVDIKFFADKNDAETSNKKLSRANLLLEKLLLQAEGEIQERSVKNLRFTINAASALIDTIKPGKKPSAKANNPTPTEIINWEEESLSQLPDTFLSRVLTSMNSDQDSKVCFSTIGKGIKPSYQIYFTDGKSSPFSGTSHKPLKRKLPNTPDKISQPFSLSIIKSIIEKK